MTPRGLDRGRSRIHDVVDPEQRGGDRADHPQRAARGPEPVRVPAQREPDAGGHHRGDAVGPDGMSVNWSAELTPAIGVISRISGLCPAALTAITCLVPATSGTSSGVRGTWSTPSTVTSAPGGVEMTLMIAAGGA